MMLPNLSGSKALAFPGRDFRNGSRAAVATACYDVRRTLEYRLAATCKSAVWAISGHGINPECLEFELTRAIALRKVR
jgi:hypothetical protein